MRTNNSGRRIAETGSALLAVLWMAAALAAIGLSVSTTVRTETDRVSTASDGLRASYLATGSVERGIQWMLWGPDYRNQDGSPRFWEPNLPRMSFQFPSGEAIVEMIPEASKLNINSASPDELLRVVTVVSGDAERAREIVEAILDWRGAPNTALEGYYLGLGPTFRPRHASLEEIEELLVVRGMTPELFYGNFITGEDGRSYASGGLRDCLSVWGSMGPFDVNTVSPILLEAFGVPRETIERLTTMRVAKPFRNLGELSQLGASIPRVGVGGNMIWTLRATARLRRPDGASSDVVRTASATVKLLPRQQNFQMPLHVLRYYDDAWSQFAVAPPATPFRNPGVNP